MTHPGDHAHPTLAVVAEAFVDRSLPDMLAWLAEFAPEIDGVEVGSGGYAPHPHCDRRELLNERRARARWSEELERRDLTIVAFNVWGNPLHPDHDLAAAHDVALRETIQLAGQLDVDRVVALAGCPAAIPGDRSPYFPAGGWLPYLEDVYERQWEAAIAPYWSDISELARAEDDRLLICLELHPGTAVYNVETFSRLAALGDNLAANIDPSHFFWQQMDAAAVVGALGRRVGHVHAKDVVMHPRALALNGLLDHRWPARPSSELPWKFATVGLGHDADWWKSFIGLMPSTAVKSIAIEHEDPDVAAEDGIPQASRMLRTVLGNPASIGPTAGMMR